MEQQNREHFMSVYDIRRLRRNESIKSFDCGDADLNDFESKTEFNRFRKRRFVNEKRLKSYPAVKICRLGVDLSMKGQH